MTHHTILYADGMDIKCNSFYIIWYVKYIGYQIKIVFEHHSKQFTSSIKDLDMPICTSSNCFQEAFSIAKDFIDDFSTGKI